MTPRTGTPARPGREAGFTIMEILIAAAILVVGLIGILALFPVAVSTGNRTMEDTTAALIAQSVEEALREGLSHKKGHTRDGKATYFLFQHDGVLDPLPRDITAADPSKDYYILLPDVDPDSSERERSREGEQRVTFRYPEDDGLSYQQWVQNGWEDMEGESGTPNGGGSVARADDDAGDPIRRTYQMGGRKLLFPDEVEDPAFDREDPLYQYSFAFTLRRAYRDPSLGRHAIKDPVYIPSGELYECTIEVFRTFLPDSEAFSRPIFVTKTYLHK